MKNITNDHYLTMLCFKFGLIPSLIMIALPCTCLSTACVYYFIKTIRALCNSITPQESNEQSSADSSDQSMGEDLDDDYAEQPTISNP